MKAFSILGLFLFVGSAWSIELILSPQVQSVIEGGEYDVCVVITEGVALSSQFFVLKVSYLFGKIFLSYNL